MRVLPASSLWEGVPVRAAGNAYTKIVLLALLCIGAVALVTELCALAGSR